MSLKCKRQKSWFRQFIIIIAVFKDIYIFLFIVTQAVTRAAKVLGRASLLRALCLRDAIESQPFVLNNASPVLEMGREQCVLTELL